MAEIYIVEDDFNILEIETFALRNSGMSVTGFDDAASFFLTMQEQLPDLILLDIMLPDRDGIEVLQALRKDVRTAEIPVIMVTAKQAEVDIVRGLETGADDYITKPFGIMELISRVRALLRRSGIQRESLSDTLSLDTISMNPQKRECLVNGSRVALTFKEFELLEFLMRNAGIVMKRDILLERIWGIDFDGETRTLDAHIRTLRQKLGEAGSHISTVRNVGYLLS